MPVVGIAIDQLHRVARLCDGRHRDRHRLRAQIQPEKRGVSLFGVMTAVSRGRNAVHVIDLLNGALYWPDRPRIRDHRIVHHDRETDETLLGDGLGFGDGGWITLLDSLFFPPD